ncbi:MAG: GNAT family N-acetyltransferase [Erysipelotrichaceae bacterium]|nr:GNAT family N-acetyltransferase [Erysipelotrichaceae bacterium]
MELVLEEFIDNNLPQGYTPYYIYLIMLNHIEIGRLVYRLGDDEEHMFDGHIAYTIEEEYRGHYYAYQACLLLDEMVHRDHYMITCDPSNKASYKTIMKLGAQYIETKTIPPQLKKFYTKEEKEKMIFIWKGNQQ